MGAVKDMLMDVEEFVYDFYDKDGQLLKSPAFIIDAAVQKFGISFGSYAEDVLNETDGPDYLQEEAAYQEEVKKINERIPF